MWCPFCVCALACGCACVGVCVREQIVYLPLQTPLSEMQEEKLISYLADCHKVTTGECPFF